jgi:hypothetical protein
MVEEPLPVTADEGTAEDQEREPVKKCFSPDDPPDTGYCQETQADEPDRRWANGGSGEREPVGTGLPVTAAPTEQAEGVTGEEDDKCLHLGNPEDLESKTCKKGSDQAAVTEEGIYKRLRPEDAGQGERMSEERWRAPNRLAPGIEQVILKGLADGVSKSELARQFGVSRRSVIRLAQRQDFDVTESECSKV